MHFEISKTALVKVLSNVNGAVEKRNNTIPILLNVKIEAKDGKLHFTATDMDIVVISTVDAKIKKEGSTTVPAQLFYDIVRKIPEGSNIDVELQEGGNSVRIKYGRSKFNLPSLSAAEFPVLSEGDMQDKFVMKSADLAKIIDQTRFAISNDETRYYLNGMFLHAVENNGTIELCGVATDGHRLALAKASVDNLKKPFAGIIIPKKTIGEIRRIIEDGAEAQLSISRAKIKISAGNSTIISKLIDGEFPDYSRVIPKGNDQIVSVNKKTIFDAVDRVATIANDKHRSIKITLQKGKMNLQVSTSDGGFADEEIEINYNGNEVETGFNSRYLLEIISQISNDQINLKFKDSNSPALLDADAQNSVFVIMPVRI